MFNFNKSSSKLKLYKKKSYFLKYKVEAISILLAAVFIIFFMSLLSHNPTDRSWFYFSSTSNLIQNWCGVIGANFSALLFYLFGDAAYLFVFSFIFLAYLLFKTKGHNLSRYLAFISLSISFAALLFAYNINFTHKSCSGGFLGSTFFNLFTYPFGLMGSKILHFSVFIASGIIVSRISFLSLFKKIFYFSWIVLKVSSFYLFKTARVMTIFLGATIWNFLKFIYKKFYNWVKSRFVFFSNKDELLEPAKSDEFISDFEIFNNHSSFADLSPEVEFIIEKYHDKDIYKKSKNVSLLLDFNFKLLPNTILNKNIFEKDFAIKFFKLMFKSMPKKVTNDTIETEDSYVKPKIEYKLPDTAIFEREDKVDEKLKKELEEESVVKGRRLEEKLSYFGIKGKVTAIRPGPVITLFEYKPEIDSKISKIISLEDDLALALMALSIRIVAPIPGRSVVGFEISNGMRQKVFLSNLLESDKFFNSNAKLPIVLGVDVVGGPIIQDLASMPHLLVAGSTGSGKSVGLNTMLVSLLCNFSPEELKLILIDPKRLEFAPYKDIPHLLFPIITNPRNASPVLKWIVQEMEHRYDQMAEAGVRNVFEYQNLLKKNKSFQPMPFIVLMIDELADLMMVAGKDIELHIARIAQMARAAGIHMVVATQRPSVDVVTGLIKVNFPSRIAFRVTSKIDSRTIVDAAGAEKLLGQGDMLYMNSASSDLQRIHGAYVGVKEIEKLAEYLKSQAKPQYLDLNETLKEMSRVEVEEIEDDLYPEVIEFVKSVDELSISGLQRRYRIGFNRSARLIERLEMDGFLAPAQGSKPRKVLKENL